MWVSVCVYVRVNVSGSSIVFGDLDAHYMHEANCKQCVHMCVCVSLASVLLVRQIRVSVWELF